MRARARARAAEPAAVPLSWDQVLGLRLRRQRLDARAPRSGLLDVAEALAGVHAQLMSSAELTLWARVEDLGGEDVATALWEQRTLVKTWAARGTLHLLPAAAYPSWVGALSARAPRAYKNGSRLRYFGLTVETIEAIAEAVEAVLADGAQLTRAELADAVQERTGSAELGEQLRDNWGATLKYPSARGWVCFAPSAGQNVRFTHPATWLGPWEPVDEQAGLAEATRRWMRAVGPQTREELARWWGVQPADGRRMLELLEDELAPVDVDGEPRLMLAADVEAARAASAEGAGVRLLPAFDQYVIAATPHADALLPAGAKPLVYRRAGGWISAVLLVDGRMAGVWRHARAGTRVRVGIEPFGRLARAARAAAAEEAQRLAAFLGGELELTWGPLE